MLNICSRRFCVGAFYLLQILLFDKKSANYGLIRITRGFSAYLFNTEISGEPKMWDYIADRVTREANYIIETKSTVRAAAVHFSISKSTVHKDVTERLKAVDKQLYKEVREVLDKNLSERHIRGGIATKYKYLHKCET